MRTVSTIVKSAVLAGALVTAGAASAATLVFTPGGGNLGAGETDYANFDSSFGNTSAVSNAGVYATSVGGIAAQPASGDQGDAFYAVLGGGSVTFNFSTAAGIFGFDLGSADDYNSLTLTFADGTTQTFTGAALNPPGPASGNQSILGTNGRVTISSFGNGITSATFSSTGNSFEFDNLGIGAVPEPGVWAMLILGFGVIGSSLRRKSAKAFGARTALV